MKNNQMIEYENNNPVKRLFNTIINKIKSKLSHYKQWNEEIEMNIQTAYPNEEDRREVKQILTEFLGRNSDLLETLDVRMLRKDIVDLFGKAKLERVLNSTRIQEEILGLTPDELQTYSYLLNYHTTNFMERSDNLRLADTCKKTSINELESLSEVDRMKAISILLSNSDFFMSDLSELENYYANRRDICQGIINNPNSVREEYEKDEYDENNSIPWGLVAEMSSLSDLDIVKYAIVEAKYGMSLKMAEVLCSAFGTDIEGIEQSEETRIVKELKEILAEKDIDKLRSVNLDENYANYEGTLNIIPNLKNAYMRKYKETLYEIDEKDYIGTQDAKGKDGKTSVIKIYNALGVNNDKADFNMLVTSLRRNIFC